MPKMALKSITEKRLVIGVHPNQPTYLPPYSLYIQCNLHVNYLNRLMLTNNVHECENEFNL